MNWYERPLIYFISAIGSNAIKIGYSTNLNDRLKELATACPFELLPVAAIFDNASREFTIHNQLSRYRIRGEWFDDSPEVWEYMEMHAHYILGRDNLPPVVPLTRAHELIPMRENLAHRGVVVGWIRDAFNRTALTSRQRQVLSLRFGLNPTQPEMTLVQVGEALGITHSRVGQLERAGLKALAKNRELVELQNIQRGGI